MYKILERINQKKERLDLKNHELLDSILKWLKTELTYSSNHIEGNTLTRKETALTIENGLVSGEKPLKDYIEAKNHAEAFDFIVSTIKDDTISYEDVILKIHSIILNGINDESKGCYRNVRVRISGSDAILPNPLKVPELMRKFALKLDGREDSVLKAIESHYKLVEIHPFIDGNGRTARLLMSLILLRSGTLPLLIPPNERKRYLSHISERNTQGKILSYYSYMLNLLDKSLDKYLKMFRSVVINEEKLMIISEFADFCDVPISTVRYYLRKGKIEPCSYTNAGYMLFSKQQKKYLSELINKILTNE